MWHDLSVAGCDCAAADLTISGTVTVPHQIAPLTEATKIFGDLSMLTDDISTGLSIPNFCGKYNFELIYLEENKDPVTFPPSSWPEQLGPCPGYDCDNPIWPEWATPCTAMNCGSSL